MEPTLPTSDHVGGKIDNEYSKLGTEAETANIDLNTPEMTQLFAEAPLFIKSAIVEAQVVEESTEITTQLADGTNETTNTAEAGDVIVTNPGGEKYVLKPDNFAKRYADQGDGTYRATGACRAVTNPTGEPITIIAPWGEEQRGGPDCMIAVAVDPSNPTEFGSDRYIIGKEEFAQTYISAETT